MPKSFKRHIGFGSTPNFSNFYKELQHHTDPEGRLAYANYDPSLGEPPTEEQKIKLNEYKPHMPTLTFIGSEKLHGENMAVCYTNQELWTEARNYIRTILEDQNGMAMFVESTREIWLGLINQLAEMHNINTTTHTIAINMEWAGGNIQRGNAACSGTDKATYIFDYFQVIDNATEERQYLSTENLQIPLNCNIYLMRNFGTYSITLDLNNPKECEKQLQELALNIEENSPIAKYFNKPDNVGEGVYLWCKNNTMLRLKAKGEKHGGKRKSPKPPKQKLTDEESKHLAAIAAKVTPVWRITQGITEVNATEKKHVSKVIKWVLNDVAKEESPLLIEEKIELKSISKYVATEVRNYFFDYLKDY